MVSTDFDLVKINFDLDTINFDVVKIAVELARIHIYFHIIFTRITLQLYYNKLNIIGIIIVMS